METAFNISSATYRPFKVTSYYRTRSIYWAKKFFDHYKNSQYGKYSWSRCMKMGWRFMYWELLWNVRKDFVTKITFSRKNENVSPNKPKYTHRLVTNNGAMLGISTGRKNTNFRMDKALSPTEWYFIIGEFSEEGLYAHPIAMRFDAVLKVHGWYNAHEVVSKSNIQQPV